MHALLLLIAMFQQTVKSGLQMNVSCQHSVALAWQASTSTVVGYNLYRGQTKGGPYPTRLNTGLVAGLQYKDATVACGQTYYYVSTAVDSTGSESKFSNEAEAVIP